MTFTKTRAWVAGTVVLCLLLSVAAWFLLISPKRAEAAELKTQTIAQQQQNDQTRVRIAGLKKEFANLVNYQAERDSLRSAMPKDDQVARLTRDLDKIAKDSGTTLDSIAPGAPTAATPPAAAAAPAPNAAGASGTAATGTAPAAVSGLVKIPVTITITGVYQDNLEFLRMLQRTQTRNYLVEGLTIGDPKLAGPGNVDDAKAKGWTTMTITGGIFALPEAAATAGAAAAPAAPGASSGTTDPATTAN